MMTFREFFEEKHQHEYQGLPGEMLHVVTERIANTFAEYADYAVDEALRKRLDERAAD